MATEQEKAQRHPAIADLVPPPSPNQVIRGLAEIIRAIGELKTTRPATNGSSKDFLTGRIHGLTEALALIYGVPKEDVIKIVMEI